MLIDYAKLKGLAFSDVEHRYSECDTVLYALGVGWGHDSSDAADRRHLCKEGFWALPPLGAVLDDPAFRRRCSGAGVDWTRAAHGEQGLVLHRPLPGAGTVIVRTRVTEVLDEGAGKDARLYAERVIHDGTGGAPLCTVSSVAVLRGQGGFGGPTCGPPPPVSLPERASDLRIDLPALSRPALTYPPAGGCNPLPAGPAASTCLRRPVLPELATCAVAARAVLQTCCEGMPDRLESLHARFAAPVFAGDTIRTEIWQDGPRISFRCHVFERDSVVLDNGLAVVTD